MADVADLLTQVPLFAGMTDRALASVGAIAHEVAYEPDAPLAVQGEAASTFTVLLNGRARVERDGTAIGELGPGAFLGEISLLDGGPRTATVVALEPIRALEIGADDFRGLIDQSAAVRYDVISALTRRIRRDARDGEV